MSEDLILKESREFIKQLQNKIMYLRLLLEYDGIEMINSYLEERIYIIFSNGDNVFLLNVAYDDFMNKKITVLYEYIKFNVMEV